MENAEMAPKVSIIIPIYNSEKYLERLFGSIQQQTLEDFEVICVNDGSSDNSKIIIENIAKSDQRFRIINQRNAGEGAARNTGLASALGEYIVFFDSDDFVERNMLAEMVEAAEADNAEIVICSIDAYYEIEDRFEPNEWAVSKEVVPTRRVFAPEDIENIFSNIVGYAANKLYKKGFIESHRIFFQEIRTHGDLAFSYAALAASKRIIYLDEPQKIGKYKFLVGFFFKDRVIYMVTLINCDKDFQENEEKNRKGIHDSILQENGIEDGKEYKWGKVVSEYDARSNISSINIYYLK